MPVISRSIIISTIFLDFIIASYSGKLLKKASCRLGGGRGYLSPRTSLMGVELKQPVHAVYSMMFLCHREAKSVRFDVLLNACSVALISIICMALSE